MTVAVVVGIDVGTTDTKALVVSTEGDELADVRVATGWREQGAQCETSADALYSGALAAVAGALEAAARRVGDAVQALGIGITGMAESGVLLGSDGDVQAPIMAWFDARGADQMRALPTALLDSFSARTGLPTTSQWSLAKLLWLRGRGIRVRPGMCWLNVPEYVAVRLGADRATEPSLASRTGLLDQESGTPWQDALTALGAGPGFLPPLLPAGTSLGRASGDAVPAALRGAAIVVAGHDHPVASFGAGAWGSDDLFDSYGTAEALVRVVGHPVTAPQRARLVGLGLTMGEHCLPDRWVVSGPTRGGLVLRRILAVIGRADAAGRDALDAAWTPSAGDYGVAVSGSTMHDDDVVVRATGDTVTPDAVWAAALRHVSATAATLADTIDAEVGRRRRVVVAGGWTRMSSVRDAKELAMTDVSFSTRQQPGAFGAAIFAAWAAAGGPGTAVDFASRFVPEPAASSRQQTVNPPQGVLL